MSLAAILGGVKLVSGLFGAASANKARKRQEYLNSPAGIRAQSEAAGFNPLVFAGQAGSFGAGNMVTGGEILAQAAADSVDTFSTERNRSRELQIANSQLQVERDRLNEQVRQATLQPNVPGIYGNARTSGGDSGLPDRVGGPDFDGDPPSPSGLNTNEAASFSFGGIDFSGSGAFSTGGTVEDALGDSEVVSTFMAPVLAGDAIGHTLDLNRRNRREDAFFRDLYYNVHPERFPDRQQAERALTIYGPYMRSREAERQTRNTPFH
ncbi:hypothetical protein [Nioella nitratireducens]|uniref:hypothetical protein n=1 Tax=Nioella nitratireducens TaxID=1287720 RepID=UPI0008FCE3D5|nr:hypothetical protein [Nioella nitratireducens]